MAKYDIKPRDFDVADAQIAIVAARFNDDIVSKLLDGARQGLAAHNVTESQITEVRVPGAFEIPFAAARLAEKPSIDAVIAIGAVVRGDTPHFHYVAGECASGTTRVALDAKKPVIFGVLTVDDEEQARERAGGAHGNKGYEAALAALEMVSLTRQLG